MRAQDQERRALGLGHRLAHGGLERVEVVGDLAEFDDVPAVGAEPFADVVVRGEIGRPVDRDVVVVEDADQVAEAEMPGQRGGLVADALHHAAVAGDDERVVVLGVLAEADAQVAFGDRHADRVGEPLPERPGRDLDAAGVARLGMAGRRRTPLAELRADRRVRGRSRTRKSIVYCRIDAWPFDRTNRSRSGHVGSAGS